MILRNPTPDQIAALRERHELVACEFVDPLGNRVRYVWDPASRDSGATLAELLCHGRVLGAIVELP